MKIFNIAILFFCTSLYAQEVIEIKKRKTCEIYHVLKNDKSVKHGSYKKFHKYSKLRKTKINGYYKNNHKDSIWRYYDWKDNLIKEGKFSNNKKEGDWKYYLWNSGFPSSKGKYNNGHKIGIWEYRNQNGIVIHKFDHTLNKLLYFTSSEETTSVQPNDLNKDKNQKAIILGGEKAFHKYIDTEFQYPKQALLNEVEARLYIKFLVDENLTKKNYSLANCPGFGFDKEAVRLIEEGPLWIPGRINGKYISQEFTIPLFFGLR